MNDILAYIHLFVIGFTLFRDLMLLALVPLSITELNLRLPIRPFFTKQENALLTPRLYVQRIHTLNRIITH